MSSNTNPSQNNLTNHIIVVGQYDNGSNLDWWIKKYDNNGIEDTANWNIIADSGNNGDDIAYDVAIDRNNYVYVVGTMYNGNDTDWWIKKYGPDGLEDTVNWNKTFGGNDDDTAYGAAVDENENVYVVGNKFNGNDLDWWIKKFDKNGLEDTTNWDLTMSGMSEGDDTAYDVVVNSNSNIIVIGGRYNGSYFEWAIVKFGSNGNITWLKTFGGKDADEKATKVAVNASDDIYVAGNTSDGNTVYLALRKWNTGGVMDQSWNSVFNRESNIDYEDFCVAVDKNNEIYSATSKYVANDFDLWRKKFTPEGTEYLANWNKTVDSNMGDDVPSHIASDYISNIFMVGYILFDNQADWWIKKYSSSGLEDTVNWNKMVDGNGGNDRAYSVCAFR